MQKRTTNRQVIDGVNTVKFTTAPFYNSDYQQITLIGGYYDGQIATIKSGDNVYKKQYHRNFYSKLLRNRKPTLLVYKRVQNTAAFVYAGIDNQRQETKLTLFLRPLFFRIYEMLPNRKKILAQIL